MACEQLALELADAVFGADRTPELLHAGVHGVTEVLLQREKRRAVAATGRFAEVEMQVAVADVAVCYETRAGRHLRDSRTRFVQEGG